MVAFASVVPVSVGRAESTLRIAGSAGLAGGVISGTVIVVAAERPLILLATSVAVTDKRWTPCAKAGATVQFQVPTLLAVTVCSGVAPSKIVTVALASVVPVKVGVSSVGLFTAGATGVAGGVVSRTVTVVAAETALALPAPSVAITVRAWLPRAKAGLTVQDQLPLPLTAMVLISRPLSSRLMVAPTSVLPDTTGVGEVELLTVGADGFVGGVVSATTTGATVMVVAGDTALTLLAPSVAVTVMAWVPTARLGVTVQDQAPEGLAVTVFRKVVPSKILTVAFASVVPESTGLAEVRLLAVGAAGVAGGVVSGTVIVVTGETALVLLALSVAETFTEWLPWAKAGVTVQVQAPVALAVTVFRRVVSS